MIETMFIVALVMLLLPWTIYVSVKLATVAFYRGRQVFHNLNKEKRDG